MMAMIYIMDGIKPDFIDQVATLFERCLLEKISYYQE